MQISASEHGVVRIFAVDLPKAEIEVFNRQIPGKADDWPLRDALGATTLDPDQIDYFDVKDLDDLGLVGYLTEGLGIAEQDIEQDAARLSAITGQVLIVNSAAFRGTAQTLSPHAPLRWIGTYTEEAAEISTVPLTSDAARGNISTGSGKKPISDAAMSGRIATIALLLMFAFTAFLVWFSG